MVSVAGNPCKQCQARVLNFDQHVEERCPARLDGGVHMLIVPPDLNDLYMGRGETSLDSAVAPEIPDVELDAEQTALTEESITSESSRYPLSWVAVAAIVPALIGALLIGLVIGEWWQLSGFVWYLIPGTPLQDPAVIYAATLYHPVSVVVIFGLATITATLVDYCTLKKVLDHGKLAPLKQTAFYRSAVRCFYWRPWLTIVAFAMTPLPFFPVRVLALSSNYPILKYVSANLAGRLPRYYLLAIGGAWMPVPLIYILLMGLAMSLVPCVGLLWLRRRPVLAMDSAI